MSKSRDLRLQLSALILAEGIAMKEVNWGTPYALACLGAFFAGLGIFLFAIFWGVGMVFTR